MTPSGQDAAAPRARRGWAVLRRRPRSGTGPAEPRAPRTLPLGSPRRRRALFWVVLGSVAVALYAIEVPIAATIYAVPIEVVFILVAAHVGALPLAVWRPREASALAIAAFFVLALSSTGGSTAAPWPWAVPQLITQALTLAIVAWKDTWLWALAAWAGSAVASVIAAFVLVARMPLPSSLTNIVVFANVAVFTLAAAIVVRQLQRTRVQLAAERSTSESERARREVLDERARIARELHDVVAHGMSILNVQATSAPYRHPGLPDEVVTEFEQIAAQTRTTLAEMRRLLGVLRSDEPGGQAAGDDAPDRPGAAEGSTAPTVPVPGAVPSAGAGAGARNAPRTAPTVELAPMPRLRELPALIEQARQAGAEILYQPGNALDQAVDDVVGLSAYRIVQEALSNALRHSPGAAVTVTASRDSRMLELTIVNGPARIAPPRDTGQLDGAGFGLRGMRERAGAVGGTVEYGATGDGGYRVDAVLPAHAGGDS